jgi:hypothetical protein
VEAVVCKHPVGCAAEVWSREICAAPEALTLGSGKAFRTFQAVRTEHVRSAVAFCRRIKLFTLVPNLCICWKCTTDIKELPGTSEPLAPRLGTWRYLAKGRCFVPQNSLCPVEEWMHNGRTSVLTYVALYEYLRHTYLESVLYDGV